MAINGGPIEEINIHGRPFTVVGDSGGTRGLGGKESEVKVDGAGNPYASSSRVPSGLSDLDILVDDDRGDQEFLQDIANRAAFGNVTVTFNSGAIYGGLMTISGEIKFDVKESKCSISLMGGKLTKQ